MPGDQLMLRRPHRPRISSGIWKFAAEARVGERLAAVAEMMCALRDA